MQQITHDREFDDEAGALEWIAKFRGYTRTGAAVAGNWEYHLSEPSPDAVPEAPGGGAAYRVSWAHPKDHRVGCPDATCIAGC